MQATKAQVQVGHLTIEGYLTDDGIFGMSQTQLIQVLGFIDSSYRAMLKSKEAAAKAMGAA